ncbi:MAG: hypothetical protein HC767_03700 [Akkermansiaceae bacterium]|nr:hypothetical protein [Akkermansiaceae bacterium]
MNDHRRLSRRRRMKDPACQRGPLRPDMQIGFQRRSHRHIHDRLQP